MTDIYRDNGFTASAVGCHWTRGAYHVSTTSIGNVRHGYTVTRSYQPLCTCVTWQRALEICDRRKAERRKAVTA